MCSNIYIYHNAIYGIGETEYGNSAKWDDGYPSGGNYWIGYFGNDNYHGPNQDRPGSDGIGDTPYNFYSGIDWYPLMDPIPVTPLEFDGPDEGSTNVNYTFSATTIDLEGEELWYLFDWGDGEFSGWVGPSRS